MTSIPTFNPLGALPRGRTALEASAGTGKTWTIAALATRYVAEQGLDLEQLLIVTFTRAATAELRERIRSRLATARAHLAAVLAGGSSDHGDIVVAHLADADRDALDRRHRRIERALATFDAATITTIHGFCHRVLAASGFAGDVDGTGELVEEVDELVRAATTDLLVADWSGRPADQQDERPKVDLARTVATLALREPATPLRPDPDDDNEPFGARALARLGGQVRRTVDGRKRALGIITFDDLLTRLRTSLTDDRAGDAIRTAMRDRYQVALIDEFQDTDPTQWQILEDLFEDRTLVLIGDPKQAIYRFRGADVHAYLDAISGPETTRSTLGTNYRSDQRLVRAVNRLFLGTTFGDDRIEHREVEAVRPDRLTFPDQPRAPLQIRALFDDLKADDARALLARDLAAEVTRLLASGARIRGAGSSGSDSSRDREVRPGDCAVLVRTNDQAQDVKDQLAAAGVHAVINGVGSVLETPAAQDWRRLLEALERPSSPTRVRVLALSPLVGSSPSEVADADDDALAAMHERAHRWARVVDQHGIATLVRTIQRETAMAARLLGQENGERYLTDFEHVAELLHAASATERLGAAALIGWLTDQAQRTDELPPEQRARRLESDERAVQVLTIHRAKGLEFPVVFCPFVMSTGTSPRVPLRVVDPSSGAVIDVGSSEFDQAKSRAEVENHGELLRLLYVALTRAEHRLVVWWWPFNSYQSKYLESGLSKLLFAEPSDQDGVARVRADRHLEGFALGDGLTQRFDTAVARLGPDADWEQVPDDPQPVEWRLSARDVRQPTARQFTGDIDRTWQRSSYSALTAVRIDRPVVDGSPDAVPVRTDEDDTEVGARPDPAELAGHAELLLDGQPAGATFGTAVHAVIEHVDLDADPLEDAVAEQVTVQVRRAGLPVSDPGGLGAGLVAALRTPLGPAFGEATLAGTARRDRLDELEFELPMAHGAGHVSLHAVAELLRTHLPSDDPFVGYADRLQQGVLARKVRGYLTGSIDLVLRRATEAGPQFHVIDHKSNRLYGHDETGSTWHYRPDALHDAMQHSHYVLQALLYQVALHRFLRWRLADYDPQAHLGAVGYTFLRGMVGPDTPRDDGRPCGVMAWRPPTALVTDLSELLGSGR